MNSGCELQVFAKPQPVLGPAPPTPLSVSHKPRPLPGSARSLSCRAGRPLPPQQAPPLSRLDLPTRPLLGCARPAPDCSLSWPPTYPQGLRQLTLRPGTTPDEAGFGCWSQVPYTARRFAWPPPTVPTLPGPQPALGGDPKSGGRRARALVGASCTSCYRAPCFGTSSAKPYYVLPIPYYALPIPSLDPDWDVYIPFLQARGAGICPFYLPACPSAQPALGGTQKVPNERANPYGRTGYPA